MLEMRKRVAGILDFIQRTQLELAGESLSPASGEAAEKMMRGLADSLPMIKTNGDGKGDSKVGEDKGESEASTPPEKDFKDLSCLEMMDVLTRQLVKWQKEFE